MINADLKEKVSHDAFSFGIKNDALEDCECDHFITLKLEFRILEFSFSDSYWILYRSGYYCLNDTFCHSMW